MNAIPINFVQALAAEVMSPLLLPKKEVDAIMTFFSQRPSLILLEATFNATVYDDKFEIFARKMFDHVTANDELLYYVVENFDGSFTKLIQVVILMKYTRNLRKAINATTTQLTNETK